MTANGRSGSDWPNVHYGDSRSNRRPIRCCDPGSSFALAYNNSELGHTDRARELLDEAAGTDEVLPAVRVARGLILVRTGQPKRGPGRSGPRRRPAAAVLDIGGAGGPGRSPHQPRSCSTSSAGAADRGRCGHRRRRGHRPRTAPRRHHLHGRPQSRLRPVPGRRSPGRSGRDGGGRRSVAAGCAGTVWSAAGPGAGAGRRRTDRRRRRAHRPGPGVLPHQSRDGRPGRCLFGAGRTRPDGGRSGSGVGGRSPRRTDRPTAGKSLRGPGRADPPAAGRPGATPGRPGRLPEPGVVSRRAAVAQERDRAGRHPPRAPRCR